MLIDMCKAPTWLTKRMSNGHHDQMNPNLKYRIVMSNRTVRHEPYINKPGQFLTKFDHASLYLAKTKIIGTCYKYNFRHEDLVFKKKPRKKKQRRRWVNGDTHDPSVEYKEVERIVDTIVRLPEVEKVIALRNAPCHPDYLYHTPKRYHRNMPKYEITEEEYWIRIPWVGRKNKTREVLRRRPVCRELDLYPRLSIPEEDLLFWQNRCRRSLVFPMDWPFVFRCDYASLDLNRGDHPGKVPDIVFSEEREGPVIVWRSDDEILDSWEPLYLMLPPQLPDYSRAGGFEEVKAIPPTLGMPADINRIIRFGSCPKYFNDNIEAKQRFALLMIKTFISLDEPYPSIYGINREYLQSFIKTVRDSFNHPRPGL